MIVYLCFWCCGTQYFILLFFLLVIVLLNVCCMFFCFFVFCFGLYISTISKLNHTGKSVVLYIIDMSVCLLPIGVAIYTMYQTRLLSDIYGIRKETRYQTLSVFVYLLLYIISFTLFQILPFNSDNGIISRIQWLLFIIFTQTLAFVITFLTSTYPIYLFRKYNYTTKRIKHKRKKERKAAKSDPKSDKNANRVTLQRFIQTEAGFKLFMQHLASEFSTGLLFFFVWKTNA